MDRALILEQLRQIAEVEHRIVGQRALLDRLSGHGMRRPRPRRFSACTSKPGQHLWPIAFDSVRNSNKRLDQLRRSTPKAPKNKEKSDSDHSPCLVGFL